MSSLIFFTDETQAFIATDTLAVDLEGEPTFFCSKAIHIPHIDSVIAGTGAAGFANQWATIVASNMLVGGIRNLDFHTPKGLRTLWNEFQNKDNFPAHITTTVYQFGVSEESGKIVTFAYRSTNNFVSEELPYGSAVKPECKVISGDIADVIPTMMKEQRMIQEAKSKFERVYIGGEMIVFHLTASGCQTFKVARFEDFEEQKAKAFGNF